MSEDRPQPFGDPEDIAAGMPVALGKLNRELLQAGHPHGEESLPITLGHLYLLVEGTLELTV